MLALGACRHDDNASDQRERAMTNDNGPVWFDGNGERVARSQLTNGPCDDWSGAIRTTSAEDMYTSSPSDNQGSMYDQKPKSGCPKDKGMTSDSY
jgi:hypothetical protein